MLRISVVGGGEIVRAGYDLIVVVRRIYVIIIVRRVMSFVFVVMCRGCRRLLLPTVVYRFFVQVGVRGL